MILTASIAIVTPLTHTAVVRGASALAEANDDIRALTAAMAQGDEDAFRRFHAAYFHRLLRYLFVVTRGDDDAARDALQETFARVARHVRAFDSEEILWNWLTRIARNAATDGARQRRRYGNLLSRVATFWRIQRPEMETPIDEIPWDDLLSTALEALSPTDRALVEAKYLQRLSVRDLAAQFQLTERAVESRLARARQELRVALMKRLKDENAH